MRRFALGILALFLFSAGQVSAQSACIVVPEPPPDDLFGFGGPRDIDVAAPSFGNLDGERLRITISPGSDTLSLIDTTVSTPYADPGPAFTEEELTNKSLDGLNDLRDRAINSLGQCEGEVTALVGECSKGGVFITSQALQAKLVELTNRRIELERIRNELNRRMRLMASKKPKDGDPPGGGDGERDKAREIRDNVWKDYQFARKRQADFRGAMRDMDWTWMKRSGDPASGPSDQFSWERVRDVGIEGIRADPDGVTDGNADDRLDAERPDSDDRDDRSPGSASGSAVGRNLDDENSE